ncbi:hypothetical protein HYDPIDRAFT_115780 [Hydnomerulius pinastri MD-312]|uniref:GRIP domain-containing protein n=1 Tax=Hydnomerulius pinastri MD-312 TaxID=994086 RepID=A0A0C9V7I4_9AGAM|nr:hypothetical protein HYDPIDRAFT_115780 [Hydnomerulius pinastri MD-312]
MSSNGAHPTNYRNVSQSPTRPFSPAITHSLVDGAGTGRSSMDSEPSTGTGTGMSSPSLPGVNVVNGRTHTHQDDDQEQDLDPLERLQRQLDREREEKENLASQYRNLLAKLTTMRTTLGNKLKQDAEELDRRELQIQTLSAQNEDFSSTLETLKSELIASHAESERTARELDLLRNRDLHESAASERELRDAMGELERCRMQRDEWETVAMQERVGAEEARSTGDTLRRELDLEREAREKEKVELEAAKETAANLQSVLEDFQTAKEHELHQAVKDYKTQLDDVTLSLAEYKRRALDAELQLDDNKSNASRTLELEQELKEKNLLIGKLRHEAVIINEHLMEALRRLRKSSSDTNVDRRLVSNVLLSFLSTPRADPKRFEMLGLLGTVLGWGEGEREKAGLVRGGVGGGGSSNTNTGGGGGLFWGRGGGAASPGKSRNMELEKTDETESFSRLWVEFLLTEANQGESQTQPLSQSQPQSHASVPNSPSQSPNRITLSSSSRAHGPSSNGLSPTGLKGTRRLGSWSNMSNAAMASTPSLSLAAPPPPMSRKGKEKEVS